MCVYGETNQLADGLAKHGLNFNFNLKIFNFAPSFISSSLLAASRYCHFLEVSSFFIVGV